MRLYLNEDLGTFCQNLRVSKATQISTDGLHAKEQIQINKKLWSSCYAHDLIAYIPANWFTSFASLSVGKTALQVSTQIKNMSKSIFIKQLIQEYNRIA